MKLTGKLFYSSLVVILTILSFTVSGFCAKSVQTAKHKTTTKQKTATKTKAVVNTKALLDRAALEVKAGKIDAAISDYSKVLASNPKNFDALLGRGSLYRISGKPDRAIADLTKAVNIKPAAYEPLSELGLALLADNKLPEASSAVDKALQLKPDSARICLSKGMIESASGDNDSAITNFGKALELDPECTEAYEERAAVYMKMSNPDCAVTDYTSAIGQNGQNAKLLLGRAKAEMIQTPNVVIEQILPIETGGISHVIITPMGGYALHTASYDSTGISINNMSTVLWSVGCVHKLPERITLFDYTFDPSPGDEFVFEVTESGYVRKSGKGTITDSTGKQIIVGPGGNADKALADAEAAIVNNPSLVEAYLIKGDALQTLNKYGDALEAYLKCIESGTKNKSPFLDKAKSSALIPAVLVGKDDIAKELIDMGADVNVHNSNNDTVLIFASINKKTDIVSILLDRGADANVKNGYGCTALILAANLGYSEIVKHLIDKGANVNAIQMKGQTALILAVSRGKTDTAKMLIDGGADVDIADQGGNTALMYASLDGNLDMVKLLVEKGADINKSDGRNTAVYYAKTNEIADYLRQHGAKE